MSQLALHLLGEPQLTQEGRPIELKSRKGTGLLAYLAVSGPDANRDTLATLLWPEHDQTRARANLRRALFTLNQTPVGAWLVADQDTVTLRPDQDGHIDVVEFAGRLAAGEEDDLRQAVELYRGDFLSGLHLSDSQPFEEWATIQRERYRRQVLDALGTLTTHHLAQAEHAEAEGAARRQLEIDDLRESAWRGLMEALARDGRRNQALAEYERCHQLLQHELGVAPAAETTALYESIRLGELDIGAQSIPAIPALRGYVLQDVIGTGAFGVVYRARQPHVEREVAVKIILPEYANQPEFIRRFEVEAQLVAGLEHLHIVPLYDYWREPSGAYLVMRLMKGGSLEEALTRGPLELEATARLLDQIGSALAVAHQQGVIHRDIKPANILLDEEGNAYLSDFGIAKHLGGSGDGSTQAGAIVGTPGYLSPEQVRSEPVSSQTDVYSLGVVLYELLVGQHPFPDTPSGELLIRQYNEPLPSIQAARPDLPAALDAVVQRATANDPALRYPDMTAFAQAFREALATAAGEVVTPLPEPESPLRLPAFLDAAAQPMAAPRPVFVARERELEWLDTYLHAALAGRGQVVFVTGRPGQGKTALIDEFARCAMDAHSDLLVARGACNAFFGVGDPYLPFRAVLGMLAGDVETRWRAGAITREHARRLWEALPLAAQALLEHGTSLIDILVPGGDLLSRASAAAPTGCDWLPRLRALVEQERGEKGDLAQSQLFGQVMILLHTLAAHHPLLLILDDLQWTDSASVSLLFHLGRELQSSRILVVGAYRAEEVALGRPSTSSGGMDRHPLEKVLAEFKRGFGDVWLDLSGADDVEGRRFVDAFLDSEPNRLGVGFREALFHHSGGHPLFTVELLRAMQERGDLIRDEEGLWVQAPTLDWHALPGRVEGVIQARIGRLDGDLRDLLTIASVEGEEFTAQVVAHVADIPERKLLRVLSQELGARHHLVQQVGEAQVAGTGRFLTHYRFSHLLFQRYLYNLLSSGERRLLHGEIATMLEALYEDQTAQITPQLARHYAEAGASDKAVEYLMRAGDQARVVYAHEEAIDHYRQALALQRDMGEFDRAARTLIKLGLTHHTGFQFQPARQAFSEAFELRKRAAALPPAVPPPPAPHALRLHQFEPRTLDPARNITGAVVDQLFSGLVELSPEVDVVPGLAHSWEVSEGGRRYVFHLRDDARWSDGVPVTAGDFEYAWKRVLAPPPAAASPDASLLYDVQGACAYHRGTIADPDQVGVRALDDLTLAVELEGPTGYFLHLLAVRTTFPVPRHVLEAHGESWAEPGNILTNGPFRLEAWQRGEAMVLVRNPRYHGRFTGNVEQVELSFLSSPFTALETFEAGGLDIVQVAALQPAELDRVRQRHADGYVSEPVLATFYIGFDVSRPPFDDPRVRRAFALAIDREALAHTVLRGYFFPATGGLVPPGMPGHSAGIGLPYDPEQARRLLADAGYLRGGGRGFPAAVLLTPANAVNHAVNVYLQAQWRENLGVEIAWETMEVGMLLNRLAQESPHMFFISWVADYADPDNFLRVGRFRRYTGWRYQAYERLVEQARRVTHQGERIKLYSQAERALVEEAPIVPMVYARRHTLVKPWVSKYPTSAIEYSWWKDVIIKPH